MVLLAMIMIIKGLIETCPTREKIAIKLSYSYQYRLSTHSAKRSFHCRTPFSESFSLKEVNIQNTIA